MRRFLFVNIGYPPFVGGAQTYVQQLAETLVSEGHQVTVYTTNAGEVESIWDRHKRRVPPGQEVQNGVVVCRFPLTDLPFSPYGYFLARRLTVALAQLPGVPEDQLWTLARRTPGCPSLAATLAAAGPEFDVVHGFAIPFESLLEPAAAYARRHTVPFLLTPFLHTGEAHDPAVERGYAMPHQLALLREADAVVTLSEQERAFLLRRGVAPERVHVIPAGIPLPPAATESEPGKTGGAPSVLFIGAATHDKGAVHLAEAIQKLRRDGLPVELELIGAVTDQFRSYYDNLPPDERSAVHPLGVVSEVAKAERLRDCALLALPSRVDSFGLVLLEAWAWGKPVIGARAGGIPAVVDHEQNGLLVPFGDVPALAAAIRRLIEDPSAAQAMGAAGWEKLRRRYVWGQVYPQLMQLYESLLQR